MHIHMLTSGDAFTPFEYSWMMMHFMDYLNAAFFVMRQPLFPFPFIYIKMQCQHSSKLLLLYSTKERKTYRFGPRTWEWVNNTTFIFGLTVPLMYYDKMPFCFDILYQHFKIKSMTEYSLKAHWTAQMIFFNCSQRLQNVNTVLMAK